MSGELEHISESVDAMFARLGLTAPQDMATLTSEWEELAGQPWSGRSTPLYIRGRTLVVQASSRSMIAYLRYGEASLLDRLADRLGAGRVERVEVVAPGSG